MSSFTVTVDFTANSERGEFSVTPQILVVPAPTGNESPQHDITWVRGNFSSSNPWIFDNILFVPTFQFSQIEVEPNAISAVDTNEGTTTIKVEYILQVKLNGKKYTHDPQIVNKGET